MLFLPRSVRVYFVADPTDMRRSFDGLSNLVRERLGMDPLVGHVFVFLNRRKTHAKLLCWTRGGFTIVHKRLERGQFTFPKKLSEMPVAVEIDIHELSMLLEGIDITKATLSNRWEPQRHRSSDEKKVPHKNAA